MYLPLLPRTYSLNEHVLFTHCNEDSGGGDREYRCDQCPKVFNWKSNLIRHQVAHDDSRRYTCENCKKVFTDPSNLQRHIRSQHIGARSHACPDCGKTFATSSGLKQHTHIHSSVKPFRCEVCFKAYTQFSNLCRHKRMHANCRLQIKCNKCGQAFSTVTSLSKHKRFCEGTGSSHNQSAPTLHHSSPISPRNAGHISSLNLSSPDSNSTGRKGINDSSALATALADIASSPQTTGAAAAAAANPFLSAFHPRPGFPFYPPFFGTTFPSLFPQTTGAGQVAAFPGIPSPLSADSKPHSSPLSAGISRINHSTPVSESDNSFLSPNSSKHRELEDLSLNKTDISVDNNHQNSSSAETNQKQSTREDNNTETANQSSTRKRSRHSSADSVGTDLSEDREDSDLDDEETDEEVAITGDSDSDAEQPALRTGDTSSPADKPNRKQDISDCADIPDMSGTRESSPKQGAICPVQMISANGFIRPLSLMVDHLHSELPFDLSRNNGAKHQRRLLEDSPEFKSKVREECADEPLDLSVKHQSHHKRGDSHHHNHHNNHNNRHSLSPHSLSAATAAMASNYEELLARHRAMLMADSMAQQRERELEKHSRQQTSPNSHMYSHHKSLDGGAGGNHHFQRPLSPSKLMAYPRPIHPMLLESMYRMQVEQQHKSAATPAFPSMFGANEHNHHNNNGTGNSRLSTGAVGATGFPAFPARYPPMLSPAALLAGTPGAAQAFDFMRAHMTTGAADKLKAAQHHMGGPGGQELLSPQMLKAKERYTCKFCGKVFPRSANLTRHLRTHTGEQPYKCKYCERSFSISSNLQRHVRNIHNKEKPFKCPLCDRCFGQQTNLDRHLKKHESDGPTILDGSPKMVDKTAAVAAEEQYFHEIRSFMGKVTDRSATDKAFRALMASQSHTNGVAVSKLMAAAAAAGVVASPKTNGTADDSETVADEEEEEVSSDLDDSVTTGTNATPSKKRRLQSDTSSLLADEEDEEVAMSDDNEGNGADGIDSATDEDCSSSLAVENGN
ncbi:unnamed protein product, partial [Oppiella nova]